MVPGTNRSGLSNSRRWRGMAASYRERAARVERIMANRLRPPRIGLRPDRRRQARPKAPPRSGVVPVTIVFGAALDDLSGEAVSLTSIFGAGDPFAYSARLQAAAGVDRSEEHTSELQS